MTEEYKAIFTFEGIKLTSQHTMLDKIQLHVQHVCAPESGCCLKTHTGLILQAAFQKFMTASALLGGVVVVGGDQSVFIMSTHQ